MNSDRIQKTIVLKAPLERVWRAIIDSRRFGQWFGVEIDGPFVAGQPASGRIAPTMVDSDVARLQQPYAGLPWRVLVERIEPMTLFAFRWRPHALDLDHDHADEPMTLVTFELTQVEDGVRLTITESGFDQIPPERRAQAMEGNDAGWAHQTRLIARYLTLDESL